LQWQDRNSRGKTTVVTANWFKIGSVSFEHSSRALQIHACWLRRSARTVIGDFAIFQAGA
jgi:hypothetical protein